MSTAVRKTIIYLLRNDLRIHDNECLQWANANSDHILPLYCFDPLQFRETYHFGFPKTDRHRASFLIECVRDLRESLKNLGSNLIVRHEHAAKAIQSLIDICHSVAPVTAVVYQNEITKEELDVEEEVKNVCIKNQIRTISIWGATLYHLQDIPYSISNIPNTYTEFRKGVENSSHVRCLISMPEKLKPLPPVNGKLGDIPLLSDLGISDGKAKMDIRSAFPFNGGETKALHRLHDYLWQTNAVSSYKDTRNGLIGENYSTKFSPWLASGSLSPREIYHSIKKYESECTSNQSTYWVTFELLWRDYFKFVCLKYGNRIFHQSGITGRKLPWKQDMNLFDKWKEGQTGVPFIDANMRELNETGWMSNRGRQNVASFLVKNLGIDWRLGAEWFESKLIDHDVCSNYGNWNYAAGIGNDPRENRKFNIVKQALEYDPEGNYVRLWVPEISKLDKKGIHHPWELASAELSQAAIQIGSSYPKPIMIALEWNRYSKAKPNQGNNRRQRGIDFYFKSAKK